MPRLFCVDYLFFSPADHIFKKSIFPLQQPVDFVPDFNYINQDGFFSKIDFTGGKYGKN